MGRLALALVSTRPGQTSRANGRHIATSGDRQNMCGDSVATSYFFGVTTEAQKFPCGRHASN